MESVKIGVIGCGVIGPSHMKPAQEASFIDLVAVADAVEEKARKAAEQFGSRKIYASGEDLIKDKDIEAVVLALPTGLRTALALKALKAGKHVLLEKPAAMNVGELRQLKRVSKNLVVAFCSCRYRQFESAEAAARQIASGLLGPLRIIRCKAVQAAGPCPEKTPPAWRVNKAMNGGGILVNWGCYDLDYLLGLTGWTLKPEMVLAQTWPIAPHLQCHVAPGSDAEEHFAALVRCSGNVCVLFERAEQAAQETEEAWQIVGAKGSLQLFMRDVKGKKIVFNSATPEKGMNSQVIWEAEKDRRLEHPVEDFAKAILEKRQPKTNLKQAMVLQRITDAIYASAERGKAVQIRDE